jgi:hypothetical protein
MGGEVRARQAMGGGGGMDGICGRLGVESC